MAKVARGATSEDELSSLLVNILGNEDTISTRTIPGTTSTVITVLRHLNCKKSIRFKRGKCFTACINLKAIADCSCGAEPYEIPHCRFYRGYITNCLYREFHDNGIGPGGPLFTTGFPYWGFGGGRGPGGGPSGGSPGGGSPGGGGVGGCPQLRTKPEHKQQFTTRIITKITKRTIVITVTVRTTPPNSRLHNDTAEKDEVALMVRSNAEV